LRTGEFGQERAFAAGPDADVCDDELPFSSYFRESPLERTMTLNDLHVGAVLQPQWDSRPLRVIAFDEETVMYDCWWPQIPGWGIDSLNRTLAYYRVPTSLLLRQSKHLRTEEYTEAEMAVLRPDLPFSFARFANFEWPTVSPATPEEFPNGSFSCIEDQSSQPCLDAAKIYLEPFGPKGGSKPGVMIEAENRAAFTVKEILWHAARLQSPFLRDTRVTTGVGIYRSGIRRKLPSYYVWGSKSRMGT
jgi:hypothetical protein